MSDLHLTVLPPPVIRATLEVGQGPAGPQGEPGADGAQGVQGPAGNPATNLVPSVFGRTGAIVAALADYTSSLISNLSGATGATVTAALDYLLSLIVALTTTVGLKIGRSDLTVANGAALATISAPDGARLYVRTFRDVFVYRAASTATVDDVLTFAALGGTGRWERLGNPHPSWLLVATWEINTSTGNDENDGLTIGTALKTWAELVRRIGLVAGFYANQFTTVNLAGDLPAVDPIRGRLNVGPLGGFHVKGRLGSPVFTGTVSAKDDLSTATTNGTCSTVTSSWTPASWISTDANAYIVKDVTNNRWAWVAKDLGGGKAKLSPWCPLGSETGGQSGAFTTGNTTIGATIEVYRLPRALGRLQWFNEAGQRGFFAPIFSFINFDTNNATISRGISVGCALYFQQCRIRVMYVGGFVVFANCFTNEMAMHSENVPHLRFSAGLVLNAGIFNGIAPAYSSWEVDSNTLFQGSSLAPLRGGYIRIRNVFFEDCTTPCISVSGGGKAQVSTGGTICGNGNTDAIVQLNGAGNALIVTSGPATMVELIKAATSGSPIKFNAVTTAPAFDPATGTYTAARSLTPALIDATVAAGGFGGQVNDPVTGCFVGKAF